MQIIKKLSRALKKEREYQQGALLLLDKHRRRFYASSRRFQLDERLAPIETTMGKQTEAKITTASSFLSFESGTVFRKSHYDAFKMKVLTQERGRRAGVNTNYRLGQRVVGAV